MRLRTRPRLRPGTTRVDSLPITPHHRDEFVSFVLLQGIFTIIVSFTKTQEHVSVTNFPMVANAGTRDRAGMVEDVSVGSRRDSVFAARFLASAPRCRSFMTPSIDLPRCLQNIPRTNFGGITLGCTA